MDEKKKITNYRDLDVYQNSYAAMLLVMKEIVPKLPEFEKFDLIDQLRRSSKAIPRLIAEGYAKKHQKAGFQKYIDDAMAESNETGVGINQARDIYSKYVDVKLCDQLIDAYDKVSRLLYKLGIAWTDFKSRNPKP
ncbi:MAG: four helix bundle protein [Candidatus Omnitrophica bacterium]|nr:four helix bundle protein [Candidatus Omnitrophota bacterium]